MAFTATTHWEIETAGDDTNNGGGFDTGVAGFPTDGAATVANTASPVFTSASYTFVAGDVGAWIYIKSGTNWTVGWYKVASVSAGAATLNGTIGQAVVLSAPSTIVGCATVASPTGATWGIDYSQSASSRVTFTDMIIGGTTTQFTSSLNPVGKNFVGNIISVTSGTGFTVQRVAVVSTSGTTATCDKSLGTGASSGGNGRLGGALASPGLAASLRVAGNTCWINSGTYSITSASTNISGGCVSDATGGAVLTWEGYGSVRGDLGTAPILQASGAISTFTLFAVTGASTAGFLMRNITVDGASKTSSQGFSFARRGVVYKCRAINCSNIGFSVSAATHTFIICTATNITGGAGAFNTASAGIQAFGCEAYSNTVPGFNSLICADCLSYNNSGASSDGFILFSNNANVNCTAYGNGRDGFRSGIDAGAFINCIAEANTGFGFGGAGSARASYSLINCAGYNNTGGNRDPNFTGPVISFVTGSGSFFTNAAGTDFSLNNNAGAGAAARAAGIPGPSPTGTSTGYLDLGPFQHADPAKILLNPSLEGL
jgi:hypothetical protein